MEEAFSELLPRGQVAKFDLDNLLRADLSTRVSAYEKLIVNGVLTPEEVRLAEGYNPEVTGEFVKEPVAPTKNEGSDEEEEGVTDE